MYAGKIFPLEKRSEAQDVLFCFFFMKDFQPCISKRRLGFKNDSIKNSPQPWNLWRVKLGSLALWLYIWRTGISQHLVLVPLEYPCVGQATQKVSLFSWTLILCLARVFKLERGVAERATLYAKVWWWDAWMGIRSLEPRLVACLTNFGNDMHPCIHTPHIA